MFVLSEDYSEFCYFYHWVKTQFYRSELKQMFDALIEVRGCFGKDSMYIRIYEHIERHSSINDWNKWYWIPKLRIIEFQAYQATW